MAIGDVTRLTTANLVIEFKPAKHPDFRATNYASYEDDATHVCVLALNGASAGTFKLAVNGRQTADITASGTLASSVVQTALEALDNVAAGDLTVTGSAGGAFTITAAQALLTEFLIIEVVDIATTGGTPTITVTTQGSQWYQVDAEASSFGTSGTQETTDVTGMSEKQRRHASTVQDATFELAIYESRQDYRHACVEGVEGYLRWFDDGKASGRPYEAWEILLTDASVSREAFEKIEIELSGRRQGAPIARPGSIWP
jgi:hypothetical protein